MGVEYEASNEGSQVVVALLEPPSPLDGGDCFAGGLRDGSRAVALLLVPYSMPGGEPAAFSAPRRADRARFGLDDGGDRFEANGVAIAIAWGNSACATLRLKAWTEPTARAGAAASHRETLQTQVSSAEFIESIFKDSVPILVPGTVYTSNHCNRDSYTRIYKQRKI